MNCEKTSALWPSSTISTRRGTSASSFALGPVRLPRVDEARVAGGLPHPQERLEHLHLRAGEALALDAVEERRAVVVAQLVAQGLLLGLEVAPQRLLRLRGQVLRHLVPSCAGG